MFNIDVSAIDNSKMANLVSAKAVQMIRNHPETFATLEESDEKFDLRFVVVKGNDGSCAPVFTTRLLIGREQNKVTAVEIQIGSNALMNFVENTFENIMYHEMIHAVQYFSGRLTINVFRNLHKDMLILGWDGVAYLAKQVIEINNARKVSEIIAKLPWEKEAYETANSAYPCGQQGVEFNTSDIIDCTIETVKSLWNSKTTMGMFEMVAAMSKPSFAIISNTPKAYVFDNVRIQDLFHSAVNLNK